MTWGDAVENWLYWVALGAALGAVYAWRRVARSQVVTEDMLLPEQARTRRHMMASWLGYRSGAAMVFALVGAVGGAVVGGVVLLIAVAIN